jgi:hypothetical protein
MTFCVRKITFSSSDCLVVLLWSAPSIPKHPKEKKKAKKKAETFFRLNWILRTKITKKKKPNSL